MARIHIEKAELEKTLKIVGTCVVPNRISPISEYIRITTKGDRIKMEAANSGAGIRTYTSMDMPAEDMSFCVNYKDLLRYINAITDDSVTIAVELEENRITMMHSGGELTIPIVSANDFPETEAPGGEGCREFTIPGSTLSAWLQKVKNFAASDKLRPYLNGAHIQGGDGVLSVSASDSKVLFNDSIEISPEIEPFGATIPTATFEAIISISNKAETVTVITDGNKLWIKSGNTTITVVLLVGKYPNVKSVIPGQHLFEAPVSRKKLLEALKRINLAIGASHLINFTFKEGGVLTLTHENLSDLKTASESISYEGDFNLAICFGYDSFMQALSAMESDNILIRMNDPRHAAVLKEPEGSDNQTVLIMPMISR